MAFFAGVSTSHPLPPVVRALVVYSKMLNSLSDTTLAQNVGGWVLWIQGDYRPHRYSYGSWTSVVVVFAHVLERFVVSMRETSRRDL